MDGPQSTKTYKNNNWLVVGPPLWKIWKSIGMIIPNIMGKLKMFQTTNQTNIQNPNPGLSKEIESGSAADISRRANHLYMEREKAQQAIGCKWRFPWMGVPQIRWFLLENPIKMDDLEVAPF